MSTISNIEQDVASLLEESSTPAFWDLQNEIRVGIVEGMNEACLITGEQELRLTSQPYAVTLNSTLQPMPSGIFAITRVEGPGTILKTSVWDLDMDNPTWVNDLDSDPSRHPGVVLRWFPFGLGQFGIYPKLTQNANLIATGIQIPVNSARPYTGAEVIPYGDEFSNAFQDYAAHYCRFKEGGAEFDQSQELYQTFLYDADMLSRLAYRKGSLRWTKNIGPMAKITEIQKR